MIATPDNAIFEAVVNEALAKTADSPRWQNAIKRAASEILSENPYTNWDGHTLLVLSPASSEIYEANGVCQCKAFEYEQPCWHRAAARLLARYDQAVERRARQSESALPMAA